MSITGCRNDALVKTLNGIGYLPIVLPRTGLTPPDMYTYRNLKLTRKGPLADYLPDGVAIPSLERGSLPSIEHHQTSSKKSGVAADFLGDALKCFGITSAPKLDLSFASTHDLMFSFEDVTFVALDSGKLDHMLGKLNTGAIPQEYIAGGYLHIAYDYAYARKLTMKSASGGSFNLDVKVVQIGTYIDLGGQGNVTLENETTLSFAAKDDAVAAFACKIGRLEKRGSKWYFYPLEDEGDSFLADEKAAEPYLPERGVVLRVEDEGA